MIKISAWRKAMLAAAVAATMAGPAVAWAQEKGDGDKAAEKSDKPGKAAEQIDAATARPPATEQSKVTSHTLTLNGKVIAYKATAGTLTVRDAAGKPIGSMFYVAYTADNAGPKRPVTFFYNGGPGSASLWLHMGSFGPVRVKVDGPNAIAPAPYAYGPNDQGLLDKTDLVFIDAMGTGYSRPLGDTKGSQFYGVDQDVDTFAKTIERYATLNGRWNSPKFIFGESYGTTRSAALADRLESDGMALNGVVILSSILNYGIRQPGFDQIYVGYLPSYAATAWYHNKVANKPASVADFVEKAREFAAGPYAAALAKGTDITPAEEDAVAQQMSAFTGLSPQFIKNAGLRVDLSRFRKELLRDEGVVVGRYDSRFTGADSDSAGEAPESDPSDTAITGAFISSVRDYLGQDLGYKTDLEYRQSADEGGDFDWDWHHRFGRGRQNNADVALDLAEALRINPHLKLLSLNGYYDMATPFFETEFDIKHMPLPREAIKNVRFKYYESGHMAYLNPDSLKQLKKDLGAFYDEAVPQ